VRNGSDDKAHKSNPILNLDGRIAWDISLLDDRAKSVAQHRGSAAYDAYALDVFRAGDRHVRTEPLKLEDITDGHWWVQDRPGGGEFYVVKVADGYLPGYPTRRGRVAWLMSNMGHDSDPLDADLLEEIDFIYRIPEPS
jgi:hypothetical protein